MNLSQREKLLAAGVALVVVLFAGNYFWSSIRKGFEAKEATIAQLQKEKEDKGLQITAGTIAKAKLNRMLPRSLPSNEERAQAEYMAWLIEIAEEVGLIDPQPRVLGSVPEGDLYQSMKFQLSGSGTIEHATKLLYAFQSKDYLHRILRYDMRPITNGKVPDRMTIVLDCEALALKAAKPNQPAPGNDSPRVNKPLDAYQAAIGGRNIFAPTNQPPQLAASRKVDATVGIRMDVGIDAQDVDPGQTVTYSIEGEAPKGMQIDPSTGKLTWTSTELGEFKVAIRASDSGIPSRSSVQMVAIRVAEPPPPAKEPPKFDVASQAYVTALISDNRGPAAWVRSKTEGKTFQLRKGDDLKLGDLVGKVIDVRRDFLEL
ncbi:MAG: putative Ig domain-containing protein [Planctomycetota bacterium]